MNFWPDPTGQSVPALLILLFGYAYVLFTASKLISEGCEILVTVMDPGLIGGLILPILGALPDTMIILFSGLGPASEVQEELNVGVGTLAGSTIMLLTLPWAGSVFLGRSDLNKQTGFVETDLFLDRRGRSTTRARYTRFSLFNSGVSLYRHIPRLHLTRAPSIVPKTAVIMMVTSISYLVIQGPSFAYLHSSNPAVKEHWFALAGLVLTGIFFILYLWFQFYSSSNHLESIMKINLKHAATEMMKEIAVSAMNQGEPDINQISKFVFDHFDIDKNGSLSESEALVCLRTIFSGNRFDDDDFRLAIRRMDKNRDNSIDFNEFQKLVRSTDALFKQRNHAAGLAGDSIASDAESDNEALLSADAKHQGPAAPAIPSAPLSAGRQHLGDAVRPEAVNESDINEAAFSQEKQDEDAELMNPRTAKRKAFFLLLLGTLLVAAFSDPTVDVITELAKALHIKAFYIAFIVTPFAANASEVYASLVFSTKKTSEGTTLTFSQIYGAVTLNNSLCLGVFLGLVFFRGLLWSFSAEVCSILFVIIVVGINGLSPTIRLWQAFLVLLLYPLSLLGVYLLETYLGWD